jgi:hypothetical protein
MSREDDLRQEITSISEFLAAPATDSFVAQLTRGQMERRLSTLQETLTAAINRVLELRFVNSSNPGLGSIPSQLLSNLLNRIQGTLTYGTWAFTSGPNVAGSPPPSIERSAATEVVATGTGSFRLMLRKQQIDISPNFDRSVITVLDLATAAVDHALDDTAGAKAQDLGKEATRRLELFFKKLGEERVDTEFTWQAPNFEADIYVDHGTARDLSEWLAVAIPAIEPIVVRGFLRRADTLTGSFKIEAEATGTLYEGTGDSDLLAHAEMDALYEADIMVERRTAQHTGRMTEKMRLLALRSSQ